MPQPRATDSASAWAHYRPPSSCAGMPPPATSGGSQGWPAEHQWDDHSWRQGSHADAGAQAPASATPPARSLADEHSGY
eukprot:5336115-Heterocapsa_arctica.AAC.1